MSFYGPIQGRTEPLTYVVNSKNLKLCDAIALRDHLHQFPAISENLNKSLKLQFDVCPIEAEYGSSQALFDEALKMIKIERDPVLLEAIKVLKEDSKNSKDHHIYDEEDFDNIYDDYDYDEIDDDNLNEGDY